MSYLRFDRHQTFNSEMMDQVEVFYMDQNQSWYNEVYNMLCGVWDGYLYTDLLESAKQLGLPTHITNRIEYTINFIQK